MHRDHRGAVPHVGYPICHPTPTYLLPGVLIPGVLILDDQCLDETRSDRRRHGDELPGPLRVCTRAGGAAGRILIPGGALVLLFVAYQLDDTGIEEAWAQAELRDEFVASFVASSVPPPTAATLSAMSPRPLRPPRHQTPSKNRTLLQRRLGHRGFQPNQRAPSFRSPRSMKTKWSSKASRCPTSNEASATTRGHTWLARPATSPSPPGQPDGSGGSGGSGSPTSLPCPLVVAPWACASSRLAAFSPPTSDHPLTT